MQAEKEGGVTKESDFQVTVMLVINWYGTYR